MSPTHILAVRKNSLLHIMLKSKMNGVVLAAFFSVLLGDHLSGAATNALDIPVTPVEGTVQQNEIARILKLVQ